MKGNTAALALFVYSMTALGVAAGEYPTLGMLFNSTDRDFIRYDCTFPQGNQIKCTFAQIKIWPNKQQTTPIPTKQELAEMADILKKDSFCENLPGIERGLRTGQSPSDHSKEVYEKHYSYLKGRDREDWIMLIGEYRRMCDDPTYENYLALMKMLQEREKNSCRLFVNVWEQTFAATESGVWVYNQGPSGVCGTINVSQFVPKDSSGFTEWEYVTRKIVTNKRGDAGILSCTDVDEEEYVYSPRLLTAFFYGCEYISGTISPLP